MTDGLIGAALNIKIVASTNALQLDIDDALQRPGRLSEYIHIDFLKPDNANKILTKLMNNKPSCVFNKPVSLAEIYAISKNVKVDIKSSPHKKVGF